MLVSFGGIFLLVSAAGIWVDIYGLPYTGLTGEVSFVRSELLRSLALTADTKKERLLRWMEEREDDVRVLSQSELTSSSVAALLAAYEREIRRGKKGGELWAAVEASAASRRLTLQLQLVKATYSVYERIQVAEATSGTIIASTERGELGKDLSQQPAFVQPLAEGGLHVGIGRGAASEEFYLSISDSIPAAAGPTNGRPAAVLIARVKPDDILIPLLHTGKDLGETGEVVLINGESRILTSLKYPLADGSTATPLEYQIRALPAASAARGEEGLTISDDYRGERVLAAYRHLPIGPGLGWGMVVKRDYAEAFAPVRQRLLYDIAGSLGGALLVLAVAWLLADRLSRPLRALQQTARRVQGGELDARAPVVSSDEAGFLAEAFNSMLERIQSRRLMLEEEVHARTAELTSANEGLRLQIEERKRLAAQARLFRSLLDESNDAIFVIDAASARILDVNERACLNLGYSRDELLRLRVHDISATLAAGPSWEERMQTLRTSGPQLTEGRHKRKDGSEFPVEINGRIVEMEGVEYEISVARDISERQRAEEERAELEKQLRLAQRLEAVGRLGAGVAHDFNNLLTGITGYTQLSLEQLGEDSPLRDDLEKVRELTRRAADLTRQLLAFGRQQRLEQRILNPNDLIVRTAGLLERVIGEDIDMEVDAAPDLGNVCADPGQIEQVLMNLALNARDAMPEGGKLTIETGNVVLNQQYADRHAGTTPGPYVMLAVTDNGTGIDEATREKIFEPFFTTKEAGRGTGLGLATVYGIVKQHGGNIWIYSEPGQGTTFKVYLPRVEEEAEELPVEVEQERLPTGTETILVVEDEGMVREIIQRVLEQQGYTLLLAARPEEAERLFEQHPGDIALLLTDIVLPGFSGHELHARLATKRPALKVIYMSGYSRRAAAHNGILEEEDGVPFLQKPFTPGVLAREVRRALDS
ncbi:MAG: ATP-binding protein [Acidobacteriota bacterium]